MGHGLETAAVLPTRDPEADMLVLNGAAEWLCVGGEPGGTPEGGRHTSAGGSNAARWPGGLARREMLALRYVGVEERAFRRRHDYVTLGSDLEGGRVQYLGEDRTRESRGASWTSGSTAAQRDALEGVATDIRRR